jgi:hypothetical protein
VPKAESNVVALHERPVYRTQKHRAEDLQEGDVTRNRFGKWDTVTKVVRNGLYTHLTFETGVDAQMRSVHLCDVQVVKPS